MSDKIVLENRNGGLYDAGENYIASWLDTYKSFSNNETKILIKLKEAGFTASEIVELKEGGLL